MTNFIYLLKIINSILKQTIKPYEIIIIDSGNINQNEKNELIYICSLENVVLVYKKTVNLFPGAARNVGINLSSGNIIGFLDIHTIPSENWLNNSLNILINNKVDGVLGSTIFLADSYLCRLFRDSIFGKLPRITLPGSIFHRTLFIKSGYFIEWVRAGEDTDWIERLKILRLNIDYAKESDISYCGLYGLNFLTITKKWTRNYLASKDLPHFKSQKFLIGLSLYPLFILISFNWNSLMANWNTNSIYYFDNITKIVAFSPLLIYLIYRGILLPMLRGVNFNYLFPFRFMQVTLVCFYVDLIKCTILILPKFMLKKIIDK